MILLDTHVLLWFIGGNERLGNQARSLVADSLGQGKALVSTLTFWEISLLTSKGRINLGLPTASWINRFCNPESVITTSISTEIAVDAGELTGIRGDPVDRILVATARAHACPLMTADRAILSYAAEGHVRAIDARL